MEDFVELKSNYNYLDSPYDLIYLCYRNNSINENINHSSCIISHILGILSGYIFLFIGIFGLIGNAKIYFVFLLLNIKRLLDKLFF